MAKSSDNGWTWEPGPDGKVTCCLCGKRITLTGPASRHSGMHKQSWHAACEPRPTLPRIRR